MTPITNTGMSIQPPSGRHQTGWASRLRSSFVHRICYDADESHVVVLLRDTYYAYCEVDAPTVGAWLAADSKGRYYNQNIKSEAVEGRFACESRPNGVEEK